MSGPELWTGRSRCPPQLPASAASRDALCSQRCSPVGESRTGHYAVWSSVKWQPSCLALQVTHNVTEELLISKRCPVPSAFARLPDRAAAGEGVPRPAPLPSPAHRGRITFPSIPPTVAPGSQFLPRAGLYQSKIHFS